MEKLPPDSVITLEAGRELGTDVLPDFATWDIRHYGDTQIAIRVVEGTAQEPGSQSTPAVETEPEVAREYSEPDGRDREEVADV